LSSHATTDRRAALASLEPQATPSYTSRPVSSGAPDAIPQLRALIAISHWPLRELYRTILERYGYGVGEAETEEGIVQQVAANPPDLVVVCADDPRVRGTATVGQLVQDPRIRSHGTAFLALTTHDMRRSQMTQAGFTDCLQLPASIKEITATLEEIARRRFPVAPPRG